MYFSSGESLDKQSSREVLFVNNEFARTWEHIEEKSISGNVRRLKLAWARPNSTKNVSQGNIYMQMESAVRNLIREQMPYSALKQVQSTLDRQYDEDCTATFHVEKSEWEEHEWDNEESCFDIAWRTPTIKLDP